MREQIFAGIVRIPDSQGKTAGVGFVVTERLIVTCSHVVQPPNSQFAGEAPPSKVTFIFHSVRLERSERIEADWWRPYDAGDVAFIRLEDPLPDGVQPLPLAHSSGTSGHPFITFGFPDDKPIEGMWGYGTIGDFLRDEGGSLLLQLTGTTEVTRGFSGAPLIDTLTQRVVGMVTAIVLPDQNGRLAETAFVIPMEALHAVCSNLPVASVAPANTRVTLSSATATFLFIHLEHPQDLLGRLGDTYYVGVIEDLQTLLRSVAPDQGNLTTSPTTMAFRFGRAKDAVIAAVHAQRQIAARTWPNAIKVSACIGLHSAESVSNGAGLGLVMRRAERISSVGHGGQILLSATTAGLVGGDLPEGIGLVDLGVHRFKDEQGLEHLFQVLHPELRADFPPVLSLDAKQNEFLNKKDGTILVFMEEGSFVMGSPTAELARRGYSANTNVRTECILHLVDLAGFWIAKFPVTNEQYRRFVEETGRRKPERWNDPLFNGDEQPVIGVSWKEAQVYCDWAELRLPTEAEWERAARGLGHTPRIFPWGEEVPDASFLNFSRMNPGTTPVGKYVKGATPDTGLMDMAGNVLEWCFDDTRVYAPEDIANPIGDVTSVFRAVRGGSFARLANSCRAAYRDRREMDATWGSTGFRAAFGGKYHSG